MISVSHLTRRFGSVLALDDVSFEIGKGEVVGFLGPNGAGKTTTLRILSGYLPASAGSAVVAGFDVLRQSLEVRKRIGYLPESVPLYREHRVIEMLAFQARLHGMPKDLAARRIPEVLERVGVRDRSRDLIGNLSRGLRQRVGLAVALLPAPEVLILDEPTSGLDPLQRIEVREILRELAEKHTVLLSSHILPEIEAICPRVIIIDHGRIAADGTQAELAGACYVRLEAVVGADVGAVERAMQLLKSVRGVRAVVDRGRLGVHHQFDVDCEGDLREDVGALAASRGWALRELSWRRPTLEEIFARFALGLGAAASPARPAAPSDTSVPSAPSSAIAPGTAIEFEGVRAASERRATPAGPSTVPSTAAATAAAAAPKVVYNLNPFDQGASRDLGRPKAVESPARTTLDRERPAEPAPRVEDAGGSPPG